MDRGAWWATVHAVTESGTAERLTRHNFRKTEHPQGDGEKLKWGRGKERDQRVPWSLRENF